VKDAGRNMEDEKSKPQTGSDSKSSTPQAGSQTDTSRTHGVFDMGKWIHSQYEREFCAYEHSACADIVHVAEYLVEASLVLAGEEKKLGGMEHKRWMLAGEYERVLADLKAHTCELGCAKNESGKCLVRVAERYPEKHREYMDQYVEFMIANLPVGSGEAESGSGTSSNGAWRSPARGTRRTPA
jgi:hypothetical protein